jgi:hypothetical protein
MPQAFHYDRRIAITPLPIGCRWPSQPPPPPLSLRFLRGMSQMWRDAEEIQIEFTSHFFSQISRQPKSHSRRIQCFFSHRQLSRADEFQPHYARPLISRRDTPIAASASVIEDSRHFRMNTISASRRLRHFFADISAATPSQPTLAIDYAIARADTPLAAAARTLMADNIAELAIADDTLLRHILPLRQPAIDILRLWPIADIFCQALPPFSITLAPADRRPGYDYIDYY